MISRTCMRARVLLLLLLLLLLREASVREPICNRKHFLSFTMAKKAEFSTKAEIESPPPRATLLRCPNHACRAIGPTIRAQRSGMESYYFIFSRKPARYEEDGRRQHMASGYQCDSHSYDIFMRRALHTSRWKQGGHCSHAPSPSCLHHSPSATRQHHLPWVVPFDLYASSSEGIGTDSARGDTSNEGSGTMQAS